MKKKVIYYEDDKNVCQVKDFINSLDSKFKTKVFSRITLLQERWQELRRPYVDFLESGLYELRIVFFGNQVRVIYSYVFKDYIVLLHGFNKTTDEVPKENLLLAKERMHDFQKRVAQGEIKLPKI